MISNSISNAPRPKLDEISNSKGLHGLFPVWGVGKGQGWEGGGGNVIKIIQILEF